MKYLKLYELFKMPLDSKIQDQTYLIKEIESLKYIIEDDLDCIVKISVESKEYDSWKPLYWITGPIPIHDFIRISFSKPGKGIGWITAHPHVSKVRKGHPPVEDSDQYKEFFDRLEEICSEVGCFLFTRDGLVNSSEYCDVLITSCEIDKQLLMAKDHVTINKIMAKHNLGSEQKRISDIDFRFGEQVTNESIFKPLSSKAKDPNYFINEINDLKYIIEDDLDWMVKIDLESDKDLLNNYFIRIGFLLKRPWKDRSKWIPNDAPSNIVDSDQYEEFVDRLEDICSEVGCFLFTRGSEIVIACSSQFAYKSSHYDKYHLRKKSQAYRSKNPNNIQMSNESFKQKDPLSEVIKEVDDLRYIIEDDLGWYINCTIQNGRNYRKNMDDFIFIQVIPKLERVYNYVADSADGTLEQTDSADGTLEQTDQYIEFIDRVHDICLENKCFLFSMNHRKPLLLGTRYLYITSSLLSKNILIGPYNYHNKFNISESISGQHSQVTKDPIFSEISHLKYLLEDEGYKLYYRKGIISKEVNRGQKGVIEYYSSEWPEISSDIEDYHVLYVINIIPKNSGSIVIDEYERESLSQLPEYEEFIERLEEACDPYGFKVDHVGHIEKSYDAIVIYQGFNGKMVEGFWFLDDMTDNEVDLMDRTLMNFFRPLTARSGAVGA